MISGGFSGGAQPDTRQTAAGLPEVCPNCGGDTVDPAGAGDAECSLVCSVCGPVVVVEVDAEQAPAGPAVDARLRGTRPEPASAAAAKAAPAPPVARLRRPILAAGALAVLAALALSSFRGSTEPETVAPSGDAAAPAAPKAAPPAAPAMGEEVAKAESAAAVAEPEAVARLAPVRLVEAPKPEPSRPVPADARPATVVPAPAPQKAAAKPAAPRPARKARLINPGIYRPQSWEDGAGASESPLRFAAAPPQGAVASAPRVESKPAPPAADNPWLKLRKGMAKDDVLWVLGQPRWTEKSVAFEFWMYEVHSTLASGVVLFDRDGVFSWRLPSTLVAAR